MHPHLLHQLAAARNDEIRQAAAAVQVTTPPTGGRLERSPSATAIRSSRRRTITGTRHLVR
jgi:hypothetical protein